jgi:signal transduction histidine kinase
MNPSPTKPCTRGTVLTVSYSERTAVACLAALAVATSANGQTPVTTAEKISSYPLVPGQVADVSRNLTNQVRLQITGTVLHEFGPGYFFLHDATGNLRVHANRTNAWQRGQQVEVIGLPRAIETLPWLQFSEVRPLGPGTLPTPRRIQAADAAKEKHDSEYVTLRGRIIGTTSYTLRGTTSEVLLLDSEGVLCKAMFAQGTQAAILFPAGTVADFTGVCRLGARVDESRQRYVHILVHSPREVSVVEGAPFWTGSLLWTGLSGGLVLALMAVSWPLWQRRKVRLLERRIAERAGELLTANQHLKREVAERARAEKVQRALYAISEAIHSVEDLPSLYKRIHEIIGTLMPAGNFYIALQESETEMVSFPYHRDEMDPPPQARKGRRGMTEYVLRTGRAALADLDEIDRLKAAGEYIQSGAPAKIWLGVPLSSGGRPFGVMALQDHHNERVYGEEEKQILSFVAGQTALAIERKRAESDLRIALAAEKELSQLKSSFVSMVSHEFRTPLEVILSSSNILDRYLERLPPEKRAAQLRAIRKSVHRMNDLIDDVLFLGKFDAGALCCQPVPLDLPAFCRRAAAEIESAAARQGAIVFTTTDDNAEATADEGLLQHILTNILSNAVKYSPLDRTVQFTLHRRGTDAQFIIQDQGCGIPAADQARLFTAFYRGSNVGQTSGSGLGLVIAKRCVDLHGGTIECQSEQGAGTTFTVTLPLFDGTRVFRRRPPSETNAPPTGSVPQTRKFYDQNPAN